MKTVAVITSTRAEFGLLMPVLKALRKYENDNFKVELVVTGTHLSNEFGHTIDEITSFQLRIDQKVEIPLKSARALDIADTQAETLVKFTELFLREQYHGIVILGDRYEMLSVAIAAGNTNIPIFHLCGGDTTEGAIDEWIRHSITKMSYLHFVTNKESYKRVIQLGESPDRVFNYGSTSIDNIINSANMSRLEALQSLGLSDCNYALCTYHPTTIQGGNLGEEMRSLLNAVKMFPNIEFIVTKANADQGGTYINQILDEADKVIQNIHVYSSLGVVRYLSLMKYSRFVLGNSSSGVIETPAFHIPTVNVGDRQRGRLQSESVINCETDTPSIVNAIGKALDKEFVSLCKSVESPYGDGRAAIRIANKISEVIQKGEIDLKKKFYDIGVSIREWE